ncbi:MAG: Benzoyl-CoA reductase subunit B [Candidatus Heimdallarchaeota archaeon LC_3]|nr:MAG: Benzoyl-CoA reductase subunit B [Candidatus Heimdallarchaeota archaeon LC_3]
MTLAIEPSEGEYLEELKWPDQIENGIGRKTQQILNSQYYKYLDKITKTKEKPIAYMFVGGNLVELLRTLGFEVVYPEITALSTAIKHESLDPILKAEELGYGLDVCGYVKTDIGISVVGDGKTSFVNIPKPDLLVCNFSGCYVYIKWWEALAEFYKCPLFVFDVPYLRDGFNVVHKEDIDYLMTQLDELIEVCTKLSKVDYDVNVLKKHLYHAQQAEMYWRDILHMGKLRPSPIEAYFEAVNWMFPINVLRGLPQAEMFYKIVKAELEHRVDEKEYPSKEENFRIVFEGVPPYPNYRGFWNLFKTWNAVSVAATYPKVGGMFDLGIFHDPNQPLESIAKYSLYAYCNLSFPIRDKIIADYMKDYSADALVIHGIKSCRSFTAGQGDLRDYIINEKGYPALYIESDHQDPRYYAEAQIKNRIDAFFESLEHRKKIKTTKTEA